MKRSEIRSKIVEKLDSYVKEYLTRQTIGSEYANFEEPSDSNGFTVLDIGKIEAIISLYCGERKAYKETKAREIIPFSLAK